MIRPTVFIGLGGAGVRMVRAVRHELEALAWPPGASGLFEGMEIDTDRNDLPADPQSPFVSRNIGIRSTTEAVRRIPDAGWIPFERLGEASTLGGCNGCRTLGRISYVRHEEEVRLDLARLRYAVTDPDGSGQRWTRAETLVRSIWGEPPDGEPWIVTDLGPRVFVLASLCGGTGGGALGELLETIRGVFGSVPVTAILLVAPVGVANTGQVSRGELAERQANSIAALEDVQDRWLASRLVERVFLASPTSAQREVLGAGFEEAVRHLVHRSARFAVRLATVLDLPDPAPTESPPERVWAWGMCGLYRPRLEVERVALEEYLAWLSQEWSRAPTSEVTPDSPAVSEALDGLGSSLIEGREGLLETVSEDPAGVADDDKKWLQVQATLQRFPARELTREFVLGWCFRLLNRHASFGVVYQHLDALERRIAWEMANLWVEQRQIGEIRRILHEFHRSDLPAALVLGDPSYRRERQVMASRLLLMMFGGDVRAGIEEVRERTSHILERLREQGDRHRARRQGYLMLLEDPWRLNLYATGSAEEDASTLLRRLQAELSPMRYDDEDLGWYDVKGGNHGVDSADPEMGRANLEGIMSRVSSRVWPALQEMGRESRRPRAEPVDASRLPVEQMEGCTVPVRYDTPLNADPLVRAPDYRILLAGKPKEAGRFPPETSLYTVPHGAERYLERSGLRDQVEFLVLRKGIHHRFVALRAESDALQALASDSPRQVMRRPYVEGALDMAGLAERLAHLAVLALSWRYDDGLLVPDESEGLFGTLVATDKAGIHLADLEVVLPKEGVRGFTGLVERIHETLSTADPRVLSEVRRGIGSVAIHLRDSSKMGSPVIEQLRRTLHGDSGRGLTGIGRDYAKTRSIEPDSDEGRDLVSVFLKHAGLQ